MGICVVFWSARTDKQGIRTVKGVYPLDQVSFYHVCLCGKCLSKGIKPMLYGEPGY